MSEHAQILLDALKNADINFSISRSDGKPKGQNNTITVRIASEIS